MVRIIIFLLSAGVCLSGLSSCKSEQVRAGSSVSADLIRNLTVDSIYIPALQRERKIRVLLPDGYGEDDTGYPVIYMMDGQNLFQEETSFAGEWHIDESLDTLIAEGLQGAIIVGIDNGGEHRMQEYNPYDHPRYGDQEGVAFIDYLAGELKPQIDSVYRTLPDRESTWIIGSSMGGLISLYAVAAYPGVFGKAGVLSPSFWVSDKVFDLVDSLDRNVRIYMSVGGKEGEEMIRLMKEMEMRLLKAGLSEENIRAEVIPEMEHNEILWTSEFRKLYRWMLR